MALSKLDGSMMKTASVPSSALESPQVPSSRQVSGGGLVDGGGPLTSDVTLTVTEAGRDEAQARTAADKVITPRRLNEALATINSISQRVASGTLSLDEEGCLIEVNSSSAVTLVVPNNSTVAFAVKTAIIIIQLGTGQVTISPAGGVTMRCFGGKTKTYGQYSMLMLMKRDTNDWYLTGDLV
jgi:hypothetical protein